MTTEAERERVGKLSEKLEKSAKELAAELIERNAFGIAHELLNSSEGTGGFSINIGLAMVQGKVAVDGKISWTRKFADKEETVFRFNDPHAPELPGIEDDAEHDGTEVKIRTEAGEVQTTLGAIKRAGRRASKPRTEPEPEEN